MSLHHTVVAVLTLALAPLAAQAQDPASPAIGLQVDGGTVLVSDGAEFVQARPGQVLQPGQRVMVPEGAKASLNYGGGCQTALGQPGVYTVSATCNVAGTPESASNASTTTSTSSASSSTTAGSSTAGAGAAGAGGAAISTGTIVAAVAGVAAVAAVASGGGSDDPPPVSR